MKGRAIIVHNLDHARTALAAADDLGVAVTVLSPPGAAAYMGAAVFRHMIADARRSFPAATVTAVLDCGGDPGLALNAFRQGIKAVRVEAAAAVRRRLADIAAKQGAALYADRGPALDLAAEADQAAACRAWLAPPGKA